MVASTEIYINIFSITKNASYLQASLLFFFNITCTFNDFILFLYAQLYHIILNFHFAVNWKNYSNFLELNKFIILERILMLVKLSNKINFIDSALGTILD